MIKKPETTKPGWNLPVPVRDKFAEWCQTMGTKAQDDCAGALLLWPLVPSSIREQAKLVAKDAVPYNDAYWKAFEEMILKLEISLNKRITNKEKGKPSG